MSDAHRSEVPPGWNASLPEHLPRPTPVPVLFAFGAMLVAWGLISSLLLDLIGGALLLVALINWIGEIAHDDAR